ncbi:MAG TPA: serine hydrolase domain-containing protein [Rhizomicrobium sp.]|nr:serine hydrolase domain-containing protein [Rhizomicrobium sp.]
MTMTYEIEGTVARGFEAAKDAFAANFARAGDYQEVGASFAAFHRGRCVVDLWGGFTDRARTKSWARGTLINVWSSTKAVTAAVVALLTEQGLLRYEDPVSAVWPEYAQAGKERTTIAQVLSHQAGLPGFVEPTSIADLSDWDACVAKLARQRPAWEPGTATSYHALTYGWLAGEITRRAAKKSVGKLVDEQISKPLGADIFVGLPESLESRVAEMIGPRRRTQPPPLPAAAMMALTNPELDPECPNARAWRKAEIPAANGQASAMGLARFYAALAGKDGCEGQTLLSQETLARMVSPATANGRADMFLGFVDSWGMGVALNGPGIYGTNPHAFGHSGWGGSFGCADPDAGVAIGYVCNQMGGELVGDPRTAGLCAAVLACAAEAT